MDHPAPGSARARATSIRMGTASSSLNWPPAVSISARSEHSALGMAIAQSSAISPSMIGTTFGTPATFSKRSSRSAPGCSLISLTTPTVPSSAVVSKTRPKPDESRIRAPSVYFFRGWIFITAPSHASATRAPRPRYRAAPYSTRRAGISEPFPSSRRASRLRSSASLKRGNEPAREMRPPKGAKGRCRGQVLGGAPVAKHFQAADIAGDRLGRERAPELEQPGPQLGRGDRFDGLNRPGLRTWRLC